jgi:hypothetical protein
MMFMSQDLEHYVFNSTIHGFNIRNKLQLHKLLTALVCSIKPSGKQHLMLCLPDGLIEQTNHMYTAGMNQLKIVDCPYNIPERSNSDSMKIFNKLPNYIAESVLSKICFISYLKKYVIHSILFS